MKTKYKTSVYEEDNCIVRIHKPILSADEKIKREETLKETLVQYHRSCLKTKGV